MGVGGTVLLNDTGLPAQRRGWPHSVGWSNSARIRFPGGVRGPAWWGFAFDSGTRDTLGHLMLRWGEQVRCRGFGAASSEAETHSGGRASSPRARRRFA
jgi:hypothetical protein